MQRVRCEQEAAVAQQREGREQQEAEDGDDAEQVDVVQRALQAMTILAIVLGLCRACMDRPSEPELCEGMFCGTACRARLLPAHELLGEDVARLEGHVAAHGRQEARPGQAMQLCHGHMHRPPNNC